MHDVILPTFGLELHVIFTMYVCLGLIALSLLLRPRLRLVPGKFQGMLEVVIEGFAGIWSDVVGDHDRQYMSLPLTFFLFIFVSNCMGLVPGLFPSTSNLNVTAGLAVVAVVAPQVIGFRKHGFKYVKHFMGPFWWLAPLIIPIELIGHFIARPMSLSLRLFGNIMGHETIVMVLMILMPLGMPLLLFTTGLGVLVVIIQAIIFSLLATAYIGGALEEEH